MIFCAIGRSPSRRNYIEAVRRGRLSRSLTGAFFFPIPFSLSIPVKSSFVSARRRWGRAGAEGCAAPEQRGSLIGAPPLCRFHVRKHSCATHLLAALDCGAGRRANPPPKNGRFWLLLPGGQFPPQGVVADEISFRGVYDSRSCRQMRAAQVSSGVGCRDRIETAGTRGIPPGRPAPSRQPSSGDCTPVMRAPRFSTAWRTPLPK